MFSYYWILRVLYIFWIQVFFLIRHDLQIFILICSWFFHPLHFLIINGRGFYFWLSIIYQFVLLWILLLLSYLRNLCLSQDHRDSPMYSSIKFKVLVVCIQPGLVICFTLDSILISMLFSLNIPPWTSPRVPKSVLYICVSFSVLHIVLLSH